MQCLSDMPLDELDNSGRKEAWLSVPFNTDQDYHMESPFIFYSTLKSIITKHKFLTQ